MKEKDTFEVEITKQDYFGNGICRIDDFLVFVEKGLVGDVVIIEITEVKKNYARAIIKDIIVESLDRKEPECVYYDSCGGCQLMHELKERQLSFKTEKIRELFNRKGIEVKIEPILSGNEFNYRNKVIFRSNGNNLGLYKEKTHEIIPIHKCLLLNDEINKLYVRLHEYLEVNINQKISEVMIKRTNLNETMICIRGKVDNTMISKVFNNINSLYINDDLILGNEYINENLFGLNFRIYKDSFFQVNYEMTNKLYKLVIDYIKEKQFNNALDLYCGTGTLALLMSGYVNNVVGIEIVEDAVLAANMNKDLNDINNAKFILGKVENHIDKFNDIDLIVLDPPRSGLDNKSINNILSIQPKSIVYVSCGADTLVRDMDILCSKYDIKKINLVDMFPNTYHVETVCILERK